MDPATELALLETAYQKILVGGVQEVQIGSRRYTRLNFKDITDRMDILRAAIYRQSNGMMQAARNRRPE